MTDRLNLIVEIDPKDDIVRLAGPLVDGWSDDAKAIWHDPQKADNRRLHGELIRLTKNLLEGRSDALNIYLYGARSYWESHNPRYLVNRQKLADALQPWREKVFNALCSQKLSDQQLAELADLAPSIEVKAEEQSMIPLDLLPIGAIGTAGSDSSSLLAGALLLPAYLAPVRHIPWDDVTAAQQVLQAGNSQTAAASRHSLLLRSEDTSRWKDIQASLASSGSLVATGPIRDLAERPGRLASFLVMPEPVQTVNGNAVTPLMIYLYAHGVPGPAFSDSLLIHFKFKTGHFPAPPRSWDLESYHVSRAIDLAEQQENPGARPFIVFSVCNSAGSVGGAAASVPEHLARYGCRVVAPRTPVTERFAGPFAQSLHDLMELCSTPGRALLAARWKALQGLKSPLGLVYSGFGI